MMKQEKKKEVEMANIRAQKLSHHLNKVTESTENLSLLQMISLKSTTWIAAEALITNPRYNNNYNTNNNEINNNNYNVDDNDSDNDNSLGDLENKQDLLLLPGMEPQFLCYPACSLVNFGLVCTFKCQWLIRHFHRL